MTVAKGSRTFFRDDGPGLASLIENLSAVQPAQWTANQPAPAPGSVRILIIRCGAIGDTLMATPLVRALRRTYPSAHLVFLCSETAHDLLRYNPHLDQVIALGQRHVPFWLSPEKSRVLRKLAQLDLDWTLALESHPSFVDLARRAGAKRTIVYGTPPDAAGFARAGWDPARHSIENNLRSAEPLEVRPSSLDPPGPEPGFEMELHYPAALDQNLQQRLSRAGVNPGDRLVGIHAGWGGRKHSIENTRLKSWPPDRFAQIASWLVESGAQVVLTGSQADWPLTEFIRERAGRRTKPLLNWAGELSILELAALIRRLDLYLAIDSGPAHMAAALGTPLVALLGPAIIEQTRPVAGRGPVRILYERVPCAPCYGTPLMKSCQDNICMKAIEVEQVKAAMLELLAAASSNASPRR
ncbi:MAG TPA: glycosyltransferase family 9 protein [Terriglobia bacterium]